MRGSVRYEGVLHSRDYLLWGAVFAMRGCFVAGTICYEGQCLLWGESVMMNLSCTFSHRYSILPMTIDNDNWQWLWQWQWQLTIDNWQWQWNDNWQWQVTMTSDNVKCQWKWQLTIGNCQWQCQFPMTMPMTMTMKMAMPMHNDNDNVTMANAFSWTRRTSRLPPFGGSWTPAGRRWQRWSG